MEADGTRSSSRARGSFACTSCYWPSTATGHRRSDREEGGPTMNNGLTPTMLSSPAADLDRQLVPGVPPGDRWVAQIRAARGRMDRPGLGQASRLGETSRAEENRHRLRSQSLAREIAEKSGVNRSNYHRFRYPWAARRPRTTQDDPVGRLNRQPPFSSGRQYTELMLQPWCAAAVARGRTPAWHPGLLEWPA